MDLTPLLDSRSDDAPSGENLEYDPTFMNLEIAAQPGEERQVGDQTIPAEEPDYKEVSSLAVEVLERSHDLRAAIFLAQAELRLNGLPEFAQVLDYIAGCLEQHWATCHPELDEDDGDPTMRINAVRALADGATILRAVRLAPLTDSRGFGRFNLRDMQIASGELPPPEEGETTDSATISAAFQDTDDDRLAEILAGAKTSVEAVKRIGAVFDTETPGEGPDLDPLVKSLQLIVQRLAAEVGDDDAAEEAAEAAADDGDGAPAAAAPVASGGGAVMSAPGTIANTNDVIAAIDRIMEYYRRNEPSSPVPILLARAKKLVNADFLAILEDMVPDSVPEVQRLGGIAEEEEV